MSNELIVNGKNIAVDNEGYLTCLEDWSEPIAQKLATEAGLELLDEHWEIIHLLRDFYNHFDHSPAMRPLVKYVKTKLGAEKGNSIYLMSLFPGSPPKLGAKIAGLPRPANCL